MEGMALQQGSFCKARRSGDLDGQCSRYCGTSHLISSRWLCSAVQCSASHSADRKNGMTNPTQPGLHYTAHPNRLFPIQCVSCCPRGYDENTKFTA